MSDSHFNSVRDLEISSPTINPRLSHEEHCHRYFRSGEFADVSISFVLSDGVQTAFSLHKIIVSQSPFLLRLLRSGSSSTIFLEIHDSNVTGYSLTLAIAFLYSTQVLEHLNSEISLSVLAAASYLQIDSLARFAFEAAKVQVTEGDPESDQFEKWFDFLRITESFAHSPAHSFDSAVFSENGQMGGSEKNGNRNGNGMVNGVESSGGYGQYGQELRSLLLERLIVDLPTSLLDSRDRVEPLDQLILIFAKVPYTVFAQALTSLRFPIPVTMDRERFALGKKIIAARKKLAIARNSGEKFDEHIVLSFGSSGSGGTAVSIMQKNPRPRQLWKINA